jgi:diguanylate cyclase (GGDEF)-like protein/PAS domain S-box-containing protein
MLSGHGALDLLSSTQLLETLGALFEQFPSGVAYCRIEQGPPGNIAFTYLYTNPAFREQTGLGPVEGKRVSEVIPGIHQSDPWLAELYARVATTGKSESFESHVDSLQQWFTVQVICPRQGHFLAIFKVESERRKAEDALRQSEAKFRGLVTQNHAAILQIEPQTGQIIDANPAAQAFYGWSHDELCAKAIQDINTLEPAQVALERQAALDDQRKYFIFPHRVASGEIRTVEVHSTPVIVNAKRILVSIIHDVTLRVKAEQQLKESERRFQAMSDALKQSEEHLELAQRIARIGSWHVTFGPDESSDKWTLSDEVRHLYEHPADLEVNASPGFALMPKEDQDYTQNAWAAAKSGQGPSEWRHRIVVNAKTKWMQVSCKFFFDSGGHALEASGTIQDVSELKRLEDVQAAELSRLQKIASRVPGLVYQYRMYPDGRSCFPFASDAIESIYRVSPADVVNDATPVFANLHPADLAEVSASIHKSAQNLTAWQHEYRVKFDDGTVRWLYGNAVPERELGGSTLWHGFITDITERRQAHEMLRKLSTAIEQSPTSIVITDLEANIEYVNPQFTVASGYLPEEVAGKNPRMVRSELTPQETYLDMWGRLTSGKSWSGVLINKRKNGELYWEESHIAPVKNADEKTTHYVAVKTDVTERVRDAENIDRLMREQRTMLNNDLVGIVKVKDRQIVWANSAFEKMLGYGAGELNGSPTRLNYPSDSAYVSFGADAYAALHEGKVFRSQIQHRCKDGRLIWVDISGKSLRQTSGESLWGFIDITERKAVESQLILSEAKTKSVLEGAADAIFITSQTGKYQYANLEASRMLGYTQDEFMTMSIPDITPPEDLIIEMQRFQGLLVNGEMRGELRLQCKDGSLVLVELNAKLLPDGSVFGSCRDISLRKQMEEQVRQLAFHDTLTNLPNRRLLTDRLSQTMMSMKRSNKFAAMMFLDLDNFKSLNDLHGHEVGDLLLIEAACRLKSCVREIDTVARFGGDEFVVMLSELNSDLVASKNQAEAIAEKIRVALAQVYRLAIAHVGQREFVVAHHCCASIGVVLFNNHDFTQDDILKWADSAMYQAKEAGRNVVRFYESSTGTQGHQVP